MRTLGGVYHKHWVDEYIELRLKARVEAILVEVAVSKALRQASDWVQETPIETSDYHPLNTSINPVKALLTKNYII